MKNERWKKLIKSLPPGLSQVEAAKYLGMKSAIVRVWIRIFGYKFVDGRKRSWPMARRKLRWKFDQRKADWSLPNVVLANKYGVSRERIRQVRDSLKIEKVHGRT